MALPPTGMIGEAETGSRGDRGHSGVARPAGQEMVVMMFWYDGHWAWWQGGLMWVAMIAFWGLLIWAIYALITNLTRKSSQEHRGDSARQILDERLARGEISIDEYQRLRDLIATGADHTASDAGSRP